MAVSAAKAASHAPVHSVSMRFAPPVLGPRKRSVYVRIQSADARHLTVAVDRMYRHARLCKDLRVHHPVPLPRKYKRWTILAGPFIDKKSREQYEVRTHTRLMVIDGDDKNIAKYLEFLKNEDIQSGIGVKIQEKAYFQIEDFFEPFEDDEAAIEREVVAELKQWRKQNPTAADLLQQEAVQITKEAKSGAARIQDEFEQWEEPSDEELGLPLNNATKRS